MAEAFDGEVIFHDYRDVDTALAGGSDEAGFVQVIQERAKNQEEMRRRLSQLQQLHESRPEILGMFTGRHGDGGFPEAVYFASAESARQAEGAAENHELRREHMELIGGEPALFDLPTPDRY